MYPDRIESVMFIDIRIFKKALGSLLIVLGWMTIAPFVSAAAGDESAEGHASGTSPAQQLAALERIRVNAKRQASNAAYRLGIAAINDSKYGLASRLIHEAVVLAPNQPVYLRLGTQLAFQLGDFNLAETYHRMHMALNADGPAGAGVKLAAQLDDLGNILLAQERLEEAGDVFERAFAIRKKHAEPGDPVFIGSLRNLGRLAAAQGNADDAERSFLLALELLQGHQTDKSTTTFLTLFELAELYRREGRYADAETRYHEAIALSDKYAAVDSLSVALGFQGLGKLYIEQDRLLDAEAQFAGLLNHLLVHFSEDHPFVMDTRDLLDRMREHRERSATTEEVYDALVDAFARSDIERRM